MHVQQIQQVEQNLQNLNFAGPNPYAANMQQQFALQQMQAQAQRQGAERVNESFQAFAEEMRQNYEAMARRCQQLEERLVTEETSRRVEQEIFANSLQQRDMANAELLRSLNEMKQQMNILQYEFRNHTHLPIAIEPNAPNRVFPDEPGRSSTTIKDGVYIRTREIKYETYYLPQSPPEGSKKPYYEYGLKNISDKDIKEEPDRCIIQ